MERDGVSFPEALKILAGRAGVEIDERSRREDAHNARLREVMEGAIAFYHAVLLHSKPGEPALAYLRGRGFTDATIEKHQLGWAPAGWDQLVRQLASKRQVTAAELLEVGLASPRQRGGGVYDRFRERVIFPIRDANGHPVGLGGRVLGKEGVGDDGRDHGPKYLNSPATPLFDKSRTLYLIDRAKGADPQDRPGRDRRGLHRRADGAPGGVRQRRRLARHRAHARPGRADHPLREADRARLRRRRGGPEGGHVRGHRARGADPPARRATTRAWSSTTSGSSACPSRPRSRRGAARRARPRGARRSATAKPIVDHLIDVHARANDLRTPGGKARFVDAVLNVLRGLADPVMRDAYLRPGPAGVGGGGADAARGDAPRAGARAGRPRRTRPVHRRGRDAGRRRAAGQRHPARGLAHRAGAAAARAAGPGVARPSCSTASGPTGCRARSPASCTAPSCSPAPATTTASGRRTRCRRSSTGSTTRAGPSARRWSRAPARTPRELGDRALAYEIERLDRSSSRTPSGRSAATTTATPSPRPSATAIAESIDRLLARAPSPQRAAPVARPAPRPDPPPRPPAGGRAG